MNLSINFQKLTKKAKTTKKGRDDRQKQRQQKGKNRLQAWQE